MKKEKRTGESKTRPKKVKPQRGWKRKRRQGEQNMMHEKRRWGGSKGDDKKEKEKRKMRLEKESNRGQDKAQTKRGEIKRRWWNKRS